MLKKLILGVAVATSFPVFGQYSRSVSVTKITGATETVDVDTELDSQGRGRMLIKNSASLGVDPHGSTWFYIGTQFDADGVGGLNDTVRVEIPAAVTPLDTIYPAVDVTTTVINAILIDDNPERALALQICNDLDADANFVAALWDCQVIKDFSAVYISSTLFNEFGTRTAWTLSSTGSTVVGQPFTAITKRELESEIDRSPNDPRRGTLAISGTIEAVVAGVGNIFIETLEESGGSSDMRVDGDPTSVDFEIECSPTKDIFIQEIRFYGGCNGIRFDQFLCSNGKLTNGIEITMLSKQQLLAFHNISSTEDIKNYFAIGNGGPGDLFRLDEQNGGDQFTASFQFINAQEIEKCGTDPGGDDHFRFTIRDDLSTGFDQLEALAVGFLRDPT